MEANTPTEPTKVFSFSVTDQGEFSFYPSDDWAYNHTDVIRFQTSSGPFKIEFLPASAIPIPDFNPLGGPLTSVAGGIGHHADTKVTDTLTANDRETLILANKSPARPDGYVGRYFYAISINVNGKDFFNKQKNGTYSC